MAEFASTGNPIWDQGLSGLARIFPDPAKTAQAGLYGAEAGKLVLEGRDMRERADARAGFQGMMDQLQGVVTGGRAQTGTGSDANASVGTDGKPMPPDSMAGPMHPGTFQPPGGGVKYAAPAGPNGSPAPLMFNLPQLMAAGIRAGYDTSKIELVGRALVNQAVSTGRWDKPTAMQFLSGLGDPNPLNAATTLANTRLQGANTLANTRLQGQNAIQLEQEQERGRETLKKMGVEQTKDDQGNLRLRSTGDVLAAPGGLPGYDAARAAAGDKPMTVEGPPTAPEQPPSQVTVQTRDAIGRTPVDEAQARRDRETVTIVRPDGSRRTVTRYELRMHPELGREMSAPHDLATTITQGPAGPRPTYVSELAAQPQDQPTPLLLPGTMEEVQARIAARAAAEQNPERRQELIKQGQEALSATLPKTPTGARDQFTAETMFDQAMEKRFAPQTTGVHPFTSDLPAMVDEQTRAWGVARMRQLAMTDPRYRNDPAAAATQAAEDAANQLHLTIDRTHYPFGTHPDIVSVTGPKGTGSVQKIMIRGDLSPTKSLSETVAPDQRQQQPKAPTAKGGPRLPPGAIDVAPPGARDGRPGVLDGRKVVSWGGYLYPEGTPNPAGGAQ